MSTRWDTQVRTWWRQCTPTERVDIFENVLAPELQAMGHIDEFRMMMQAHIAKYFFTAQTWESWVTLCNTFHVDPFVTFEHLKDRREFLCP